VRAAGVLVLAAFLLPEAGAAEPVLSYDPPAGWARGPYRSPVVFTAPGNDAELHIYGFQRYEGDVRQRFRQTRLFELIGIEHRESGTLQPPQFAEVQVQGAGAAPLATFVARQGGANRLHLRIAIPQPGAVALVDFSVRSQDAWNRFLPEVDRVVASMRVGDSPAPAAATAPAARPAQGVSGLYLATVRRMVFRPSFSGGTGSSEWTTTTEYYLLSPEGKAYRGYGLPEVPGGDLRRFDFERARRADPGNSGTYAASGTRVTFILGAERLSGTLAGADELEIRGTKFRRSAR
jgi:hypothetical protein